MRSGASWRGAASWDHSAREVSPTVPAVSCRSEAHPTAAASSEPLSCVCASYSPQARLGHTLSCPKALYSSQAGTCQCVLEEDAAHRATCALLDVTVEHHGTTRPRGQDDARLRRRRRGCWIMRGRRGEVDQEQQHAQR
eukprot:scaffold136005_cov145-Phaeocystis_antarctica.AAC.1